MICYVTFFLVFPLLLVLSACPGLLNFLIHIPSRVWCLIFYMTRKNPVKFALSTRTDKKHNWQFDTRSNPNEKKDFTCYCQPCMKLLGLSLSSSNFSDLLLMLHTDFFNSRCLSSQSKLALIYF